MGCGGRALVGIGAAVAALAVARPHIALVNPCQT